MNNIPFKVIFIFLISICLYSCCIELRFKENETYWADAYEKGDIIIFKSDSLEKNKQINHFDTIFILNKTHFIPTGDCNLMVSNYDVEGFVIDYCYSHNSIKSEPIMLVQHYKEPKGNSFPILRVYNAESHRNEFKDTTIVLNTIGVKLNDCYAFHSTSDGWGAFKLKTYVWSRKMGLVMFEGFNGEKFEFLKKVKNK